MAVGDYTQHTRDMESKVTGLRPIRLTCGTETEQLELRGDKSLSIDTAFCGRDGRRRTLMGPRRLFAFRRASQGDSQCRKSKVAISTTRSGPARRSRAPLVSLSPTAASTPGKAYYLIGRGMIDVTKVRGADGKGELLVSTRRRVLRSLGIGSRQAVL